MEKVFVIVIFGVGRNKTVLAVVASSTSIIRLEFMFTKSIMAMAMLIVCAGVVDIVLGFIVGFTVVRFAYPCRHSQLGVRVSIRKCL